MNTQALSFALIFAATQAMANGYMGAGMGRGTIDPTDSSISMSRMSNSYYVQGGYDYNDFLGAGIGLSRLAGRATQNSAHFSASTDVLFATVNGYLPLSEHFRLQAKLGGSVVTGRATGQENTSATMPGHAFGKGGLTYGAGGEYSVTEYFGVSLEYLRFSKDEKMTAICGTFHF